MYTSEFKSYDYLHLNSSGIEYLNENCSMLREKGRVDYHILYIYRGKCYVKIDGKEICASEGSVIFFMPGEIHSYRFEGKDNSISCYIHFSGTGCDGILNKLNLSKKRIINVGKSESLKHIIEKMVLEHGLKKNNYEDICSAYLMEFLAVIIRKYHYINNPEFLKNEARIEAVCSLMHENYYKNNPLVYYADFCNLSIGRFAHIFKSSTGVTPLEYINRIKIEKAIELLTATDMSISQIAEKTGFSNQSYFGRMFKKYVGVSPAKYIE